MSTSTLQILTDANELLAVHAALILRVRSGQQIHRLELNELDSPPEELLKLPLIHTSPTTPSPELAEEKEEEEEVLKNPVLQQQQQNVFRQDLTPVKRARAARYVNYVPEEETIRNDYSQRYVDSGEWPQNWVLGAELDHRFEEYPKQRRLLDLKKVSVNQYALPPTYLSHSDFLSLQPSKFDVILLDPPFNSSFTWNHLQELPVPSLASDPSFVFLWIGSGAGEGLERGREVLAKWGYRRCEDIVWIKTNKGTNQGPGTDPPTTSIFTRTKQHCLMGIRGTVRRSTDSWFVHCNVDTDVIIWEGDPADPTRKPPEMYTLIENFCLGMRRLELFGKLTSLRRGWVTVCAPGQEDYLSHAADRNGNILVDTIGEDNVETRIVARRWNQVTWEEGIKSLAGGNKPVVPMTPEIETLRPKSPVRPGQTSSASGTTQTPSGAMGNIAGMPIPVGMPMNMNTGPRFSSGNKMASNNQVISVQNQMMMQPMMPMNMTPMGMGMDEVMGNWNPMMGNMAPMGVGMGGMNMGPPQAGTIPGMGTNRVMPNAGLGISSMGMDMGAPGMTMQMMNQMGQIGMGGLQGTRGGGGGFMGGMGGPLFSNEMNPGWGGMEGGGGGGWDGGQVMNAQMNIGTGMNPGGMNMGNMGMGMGMDQSWGNF